MYNAYVLILSLVFAASLLPPPAAAASAEEGPELNALYAEAYEISDARTFLESTIKGVEEGSLLLIDTGRNKLDFVVVPVEIVIRTLATKVKAGRLSEKEAAKIVSRYKEQSLKKVSRLRSLHRDLDRRLKETRKKIASLKKKLKKEAKSTHAKTISRREPTKMAKEGGHEQDINAEAATAEKGSQTPEGKGDQIPEPRYPGIPVDHPPAARMPRGELPPGTLTETSLPATPPLRSEPPGSEPTPEASPAANPFSITGGSLEVLSEATPSTPATEPETTSAEEPAAAPSPQGVEEKAGPGESTLPERPEPPSKQKKAVEAASAEGTGQAEEDSLGSKWVVRIGETTARWVRRPGTDVFDGVWIGSGGIVRAAIEVKVDEEGRVSATGPLEDESVQCTYSGMVSENGVSASGTVRCPDVEAEAPWKAIILR